jgi:hypothetical protein
VPTFGRPISPLVMGEREIARAMIEQALKPQAAADWAPPPDPGERRLGRPNAAR